MQTCDALQKLRLSGASRTGRPRQGTTFSSTHGNSNEGILPERGAVSEAPPMVGSTWTRVRFTLGSDCLPALSQGTTLPLPHVSWTAYCSHARDLMIWVIQGCISTSYLSMSPWGLFTTSYSLHLHGALYLMTDYYVYDWRRVLKPASADALWVSLRFHY